MTTDSSTTTEQPTTPPPQLSGPEGEALALIPRIIHYPHPSLKKASVEIKRVDATLRAIIARMFDLMYRSRGVGLAANQIDLPLRLFVANLAGERGKGEELVFINPVLSQPKGTAEDQEGCLSIPGLYADVKRPKEIRVRAYNLQGEEIDNVLTGMMSRVVQHETDHLDGVLFTDRLSDSGRHELRVRLQEFEIEFAQRRAVGGFEDQTLADRRGTFLKRYA